MYTKKTASNEKEKRKENRKMQTKEKVCSPSRDQIGQPRDCLARGVPGLQQANPEQGGKRDKR